ncbi:hypothetical protein AHAS_Ahas16G0006100 [Arachis hypogaea]
MTHKENEPFLNLETTDKIHHIEVEDNQNSEGRLRQTNFIYQFFSKSRRKWQVAGLHSGTSPLFYLRPFVSKLRPFGAGTPAMDVLTDVVDNDEGVVDSRPTATVGAGRKLAVLPSNAKPPKIPKVNKTAAGGEARNAEEHNAKGNKENKDKEIYCFDVTRGMKCKFKPNPKMGLKSEEIQAAVFIFSAELDPGKELLKIGDVTTTRKDFESLCPTQQISQKILYLTALKYDIILDGNNLGEILVPMVEQFMQPTKDLQFIYISVRDNEHRYLMVISIHDSIIGQLDSYLEDDDIQRHRNKMTIVVSDIVINTLNRYHFFNLVAHEHVNRDSPSWVLQWMNLEHAFDAQCSEVHVLDENGTRMYTAMQLFYGRFNELKAEIAPLIQEFWSMHVEEDDY